MGTSHTGGRDDYGATQLFGKGKIHEPRIGSSTKPSDPDGGWSASGPTLARQLGEAPGEYMSNGWKCHIYGPRCTISVLKLDLGSSVYHPREQNKFQN